MTVKKRISRVLECILLIILFIMFIFPFYWTLITSVKDLYEAVAYPPTFWPSSIHFENYADASKAFKEMGWKANLDIVDACRDSWNWQKNNPDGY